MNVNTVTVGNIIKHSTVWSCLIHPPSVAVLISTSEVFHYESKPLPGYLQDFINPCCDARKHNFVSSSRPEYDVISTWYGVSVSGYLRWRRKKHRMMQVSHTLHDQPDQHLELVCLATHLLIQCFFFNAFFIIVLLILLYKTTTLWRNAYVIVNIAIFFTKYLNINILTIL